MSNVDPIAVEALQRPTPRARIAVVGASRQTWKYGYIITADLLGRGYEVCPVNPREAEVAGVRCVPSVGDCGFVDIVNVVVPPEVSLELARTLDPACCRVLWFQPGSFDAEVEAVARARFAHVVAGPCIMVVARWSATSPPSEGAR